MKLMTIASAAIVKGSYSTAMSTATTTKMIKRKRILRRRGRSPTTRHPEDSTNAACNIPEGDNDDNRSARKRGFRHQQHYDDDKNRIYYQHQMLEPNKDFPFLEITIAFAERLALFGHSTLALITSFVLLVFAAVVALGLVNVILNEEI